MPELKRRILHKIKIDEISGVDNPCQEHARVMIMKRASEDDHVHKMFDGSFPIANAADLKKAIEDSVGVANPAAVRRHIVRCAKALGAVDQIPTSWNVAKSVHSLPDRLAELKSKIVGLSDGVSKVSTASVEGDTHQDTFLGGPRQKKKKLFDSIEKLRLEIESFSKSVVR